MSGISSKYFTTGEFAKLWGIKKQTLFHYDETGIFKPAKRDANGYRYYNYPQFEVFGVISVLKEMGMSLSEIKEYLDHRSPAQLIHLFHHQMAKIDDEIEHLKQIKKMMQSKIQITNLAEQIDCNAIEIQELDEEYLILSDKLDSSDDHQFFKGLTDFLKTDEIKASSWYAIGTMISQQNILNEAYTKYTYFYSRVSDNTKAQMIYLKPKGLYVIGYHKGSFETVGSTYKRMLTFMKQNNLKVAGPSYEEFLLDEISVKGYENYITEIRIQVEWK